MNENLLKIDYTANCTKVYDCYQYNYTGINIIGGIIYRTRKEMGLPVTRTAQSYANEIRAHKRAYLLGYKRDRTKDCGCEEPISKKNELKYKIFGR